MKKTLYNLQDPERPEDYECFYCGEIVEVDKQCPECIKAGRIQREDDIDGEDR